MHRYDEAVAQMRRTLVLDPNYPHGSYLMGVVLTRQGRYAEAVSSLQRSVELGGEYEPLLPTLIYAHDRSGDHATARKLMGMLTERARRGEVGPFSLAIAYTGLGETDRAIKELERGIEQRDIFMPENFFDPLLDPLRGDPRFRRVEERMGLAPSAQAPSSSP
jgi:tetratricopeptide (TPR) repeat protein